MLNVGKEESDDHNFKIAGRVWGFRFQKVHHLQFRRLCERRIAYEINMLTIK